MLYLFVGPTGSGKSTIIKELINYKEFNDSIKYINSFTTRNKRKGESNGNPYFFINKEQFISKLNNGEFIEHEEIHNNYYGLLKETIDSIINVNDCIYFKDIGVEGALYLKNIYKKKVITIFIDVKNDEVIINRLKERGDSKEDLNLRLKRVEYERSFIPEFDHYLINDKLEDSVSYIKNIIKKI